MSENEEDLFGMEEEEAPVVEDSNPMKQLRRHANKLEKDLKARDTELEDLRKFRDEFNNKARTEKVSAVFTELGLNPVHSRFWQLENPEAEPDAAGISKWAVENGFAQATEETPVAEGFTPTTSPDATPLGSKRLSRQEWQELAATDPAAAQTAFQKGRVDLSDVRVGLGPQK